MTSQATPETSPTARLGMVNIDCADPCRLAAFYGQVLGWEVTHSDDEYAMIAGGGTAIGFGRVAEYTPPDWPDLACGKQFHLDLSVEDVPSAEASCRELGAKVPDFQPGADRWRVLLDPDGHPFCLSRWTNDT